MLKKITFCFLVALLICTFTICAFAAEWSAVSTALIVDQFEGAVGTDRGTVDYRFYLSDDTYIDSNIAYTDPYVYMYFDELDYVWALYATHDGITGPVDTIESYEWTVGEGEVRIVSDDPSANYDDAIYLFNTYVAATLTAVEVDEDPVYTGIFAVFTQIITWITAALLSVVALFWANGSLTFFGILTLIALGIALFFLLCGIISRFLRFRS